ncbi:MAG: tetratricopeptide repeat protein [Nitrospirota bacterium]
MIPKDRLVRVAAPLTVVLAALAAFAPVLGNDFVEWDDQDNFVDNPSYRGLEWAHLAWMVTTMHLGVYQPLSWLVAAVEYTVGGLQPAAYHAGSWTLHAAAAAMVYVVSKQILAGLAPNAGALRLAAVCAALLWALHPLRVEAVAWASAQGYPLAGVFVLASVTAYLHTGAVPPAERARWMGVSVAAAALAYLAKPVAVTLPVVLLLLDWYPLRRFAATDRPWSVWIEKWPYVVPAALIAGIAPWARATLGTIEDDYRLGARFAQAGYGLAYYLGKTVAPVGLSFYVPLAPDMNPLEPRFLVSGLLVAGLAIGAWRLRRAAPGVTVALACYVALLLPVLGLIPQGAQLVADRYAYFAGIPLAIAVSAGGLSAWRRVGGRPVARISLLIGAMALLTTWGAATWQRTAIWRDSATLFRHTATIDPLRFWTQAVTANPRSARAHLRLGAALAAAGRHAEAIGHFDAAAALAPDNANARLSAGLALARLNRLDEAITAYQRGLELRPTDATGHAHLGELLARRGDLVAAEREYRLALSLVAHPDLLNSLGVTLAQQGRFEEAAAAFREALRLDPTHEEAGANLRMAPAHGATGRAPAPDEPTGVP